MAQKIIIVGGLADEHDHDALIEQLEQRAADVEWEWYRTVGMTGHQVEVKALNRLTGRLTNQGVADTKVVLLRRLNKGIQNRLTNLKGLDPVRANTDFATGDELVVWLLSPEAGLIPPRTWEAEERAAAFFCILAKLLKKKSWNKDRHGHTWTHEVHLLGDSPVNVHPGVRGEANGMLARMEGTLLLTKGGSKTPKEWCVWTGHLAAVKKAFLLQSLVPLDGIAEIKGLLDYIRAGNGRRYPLDDVIDVERVRTVCREPERTPAGAAKPE